MKQIFPNQKNVSRKIIPSPFDKYLGKKNDDILNDLILPILDERLKSKKRFVDMFFGTGRVMLNLQNSHEFIVNDICEPMVDLWKALQEYQYEFMNAVEKYFHPSLNNEEDFLKMRDEFNQDKKDIENLAKFAALIYRTRQGEARFTIKYERFNPTFYKRNPIFPRESYEFAIRKLRENHIEFHSTDFSHILSLLKKGDLVYGDAPYYPTNGKIRVFKNFKLEDHQRLHREIKKLSINGAEIWLSNFYNFEMLFNYELITPKIIDPFSHNAFLFTYPCKGTSEAKKVDTKEMFWRALPA